MAGRLGLESWPDDSPPRDLTLDRTPFQSWTRLWNSYEGMLDGLQVAVLDFRKRQGRAAWSRTVIAVRTRTFISDRAAFYLERREVDE